MKAPGRKGHGVTGDPHAPKLPPIRDPGKPAKKK
jgi:hypothetical protein